jgi:hypothetical protein
MSGAFGPSAGGGGGSFNPAAPGPIGATTPSTGKFTELDITSALPGALEVAGGITAASVNGATVRVQGIKGFVFGDADTAPNATGFYFFALGPFAAFSATTADFYVALGLAAGGNNLSGDSWVAVGPYAAQSNPGDRFVAIGSYAGSASTRSDSLFISSTAAPTTTPLIYGEFDNNNLALLGASQEFNGGKGIMKLAKATALPIANPDNGGFTYVDSAGNLKYWGPNGTITTIAPA